MPSSSIVSGREERGERREKKEHREDEGELTLNHELREK